MKSIEMQIYTGMRTYACSMLCMCTLVYIGSNNMQ